MIGSVSQHELMMGPAERADVIIDFSKYAGKTVILYNDAPAPVPATDSRLDYFTNDASQTATGGTVSTLAGYGPNTRTIMVFHVAASTPKPFDLAGLMDAWATTSTHQGVFARDQNPVIVPQGAYDSAYNGTFSTGTDAFARIQSNSLTFHPLDLTTPTKVATNAVTINFKPKAIQELFTNDYGRMNAILGVELPFTNGANQTTVPLGMFDPATEIFNDTNPAMTQIGQLGDGTQIWKITHNGVDTHPVHFHLFNVQVINRVGWDGQIKPPDGNELGWKDTVRMNPLEDIIIAMRPVSDKTPFGVPNSVRLLDPSMPAGTKWRSFDPLTGNPVTITNVMTNFGWEYVWHCHILSHEEMSMMRPIVFNVATASPTASILRRTNADNHVDLAWTDPTPPTDPTTYGNPANEIGWYIQRAPIVEGQPGTFATIATVPANTTTYSDPTIVPDAGYAYRVVAYNVSGNTNSNVLDVPGISVSTSASGTYGALSTLALVLTFSKPVVVTGGVPFIDLNTGGVAYYGGGSGTNQLRFLYTVARGDSAARLDYPAVDSLSLPNGVSINYQDGSGAATLTLPTPGTTGDGLWAANVLIDPRESPGITWSNPADVPYGTALDQTQLNATSSVPGKFVYTPGFNTVLNAGLGQSLKVAFTPTDLVNFMPSTATVSLNVLKAGPTFSLISPSQAVTYGTSSITVSGRLRASSAIPVNQYVTVSIAAASVSALTRSDGSFTASIDTHLLPASATPYVISYSYAGDANFSPASTSATTLRINQKDLTITADSKSKVYGQTLSFAGTEFSVNPGGLVNGDTVNLVTLTSTGAGLYASVISPGPDYPITASAAQGSGLSNYVIHYVAGTLHLLTAPLDVVGVAALNRAYDRTNNAQLSTAGAHVHGALDPGRVFLDFTGAVSTFADKNVGIAKPVTISGVALTGPDAGNYYVIQPTASADITPRALNVTATATSKVYDGSTAAAVSLADNRLSGDSFTVSHDSAVFIDRNAGLAKEVEITGITLSGVDAANYQSNPDTETTADISVRPITVTAATAGRNYDGTTASSVIPLIAGGLGSGDQPAFTELFDSSGVGQRYLIPQGQVLDGNHGANYQALFVVGQGSISPASITVSASPETKIYGNVDPNLAYQVTSGTLFSGDSFTGSLSRDAGENVGGYQILRGNLSAGPNYTMTYSGANLSITPRSVTVTADPATKIFGQPDPVFNYHLSSGSLVPGDGFVGSLTRVAGEAQGNYAIQQGSLGLSANYNLSYQGAQLSIVPSPDTKTVILGLSPAASVYGQSVTFTAQVTPVAGSSTIGGTIVFQDGGTVLGTVPFDNSVAVLTTSALTVGSHSVTAVYQGAGGFLASTSAAFVQNVSQAQTATQLAVTRASNKSKAVITVDVFQPYQGPLAPSGTIEIIVNGRLLQKVAVVNGEVQVTVPMVKVMNKTLKAKFISNNATFGSSVSKNVPVPLPKPVVKKAGHNVPTVVKTAKH